MQIYLRLGWLAVLFTLLAPGAAQAQDLGPDFTKIKDGIWNH